MKAGFQVWVEDHQTQTLWWSAQSLDLNPIKTSDEEEEGRSEAIKLPRWLNFLLQEQQRIKKTTWVKTVESNKSCGLIPQNTDYN